MEITELLLKSGADPNIRDCAFGEEENGRTPAHIACSREDSDQVLQLNSILKKIQIHFARYGQTNSIA